MKRGITEFVLTLIAFVSIFLLLADSGKVYYDNFSGKRLNENFWNLEKGARHFAQNDEGHAEINNGEFVFRVSCSGEIKTAIANTKGKVEIVNGIVEIRAKLSPLPGMWVAAWLYSDDAGKNENNPYNNGFEVDIFECRYNDDCAKYIGNEVSHAIHYGGYGDFHQAKSFYVKGKELDNGWHVYRIEIQDGVARFFVDGEKTWETKGFKTVAKHYLVLSAEIYPNLPGWTSSLPDDFCAEVMRIDYVKITKQN